MQVLAIKECLDAYDKDKGLMRTWVKQEKHIKKLIEFYEKLKYNPEHTLTPRQLLDLANIVLTKTTRNGHLSCTVFEILANQLGGMENLSYLAEKKCLNRASVFLTTKYRGHAPELVLFIALVSSKLELKDKFLKRLINSTNVMQLNIKLTEISKLATAGLLNLASLNLIMKSNFPAQVHAVLLSLNEFKLDSQENIKTLPDGCELQNINEILSILKTKNPRLMTQQTIEQIYAVTNKPLLAKILSLFKSKAIGAGVISILLENIPEEENYNTKIISNFLEAGWNILPYLPTILTNKEDSYRLNLATEILRKISPPITEIAIILNEVFNNPVQACSIARGVKIFAHNRLLTHENILTLFLKPEYASGISEAVTLLINKKLYNEANKNLIVMHADYAQALAKLIIQLAEMKIQVPVIEQLIVNNPEKATLISGFLDVLYDSKIATYENIHALFDADLINDKFSLIFHSLNMNTVKIKMNQSNFEKLLKNKQYLNVIKAALHCFHNAQKFNQTNFDMIMDDPVHALDIAQKNGGLPRLPWLPSVTSSLARNEGVVSRKHIKDAARILGRNHLAFFPQLPMGISEKKNALSREVLLRLQNEVLIIIAQYCGDESLGIEVERKIAEETFYQFCN